MINHLRFCKYFCDKYHNKYYPDISDDIIADIKQRILNGEDEIYCPMCGSLLVTRIAKMYDLEDNLMLHPKAHCSKCVFQIKD